MKFVLVLLAIFAAGWSFADETNAPKPVEKRIMVADVKEAITPVTERYIKRVLREAESEKADAVLFRLDTPGGLLDATRGIVQAMLGAKMDTFVYISPKGARAGSAGVFITLSAKYAAAAPGCNIGAAHPVNGSGSGEQKDDENSKTLMKKVLNDTVAFMQSISKERKRNADFAVKTVTESVSVTGDEAKKNGILDFIAEDETDLAKQAYGRDARITFVSAPKTWAENLLSALANPNLTYFLMILGFYGILYEIIHPGTIFSGAVGAILLITALYSMQTLPVNYAGFLLIALAFIFILLEIYLMSFGLLTVGALISLVLGSAMLFDTDLPFMKVAVSVIATMAVFTGAIFLTLAFVVGKSIRQRSRGGSASLAQETGKAAMDFFQGKGKVRIHGELWNAVSDETLETNDEIRVESIDGMVLKVKKVK
jgi:membrane-bound serine protease (ClpP class)